jgi:ubiquinone/menaquinone biosynthesis C-methylase UbiE
MDQSNTTRTKLLHMLTGYWSTQVIYVAAKLGIADLLEHGPKTSDELAISTGTHAPSLYRLLRALANLEVFEEDETGCFSLTPLGQCLVSSTPGSMRARAIIGGEEFYSAWADLLNSIQTGDSAFDHVFKMPLFQYLAQNENAANNFNNTMAGSAVQAAIAIITAYDFSWARTIVDIGGGDGPLIASILNANPQARGILLDTPYVVDSARKRLVAAGLSERCDVVVGDFFKAVPEGGDIYLLSWIIHDWDDERSITILKNCHRVMQPGGKLLLLEEIVPGVNETSMSKLYDLHMLVLTDGGGRERTESEYRKLLDKAGFRITTIIPTTLPRSLIEGTHT